MQISSNKNTSTRNFTQNRAVPQPAEQSQEPADKVSLFATSAAKATTNTLLVGAGGVLGAAGSAVPILGAAGNIATVFSDGPEPTTRIGKKARLVRQIAGLSAAATNIGGFVAFLATRNPMVMLPAAVLGGLNVAMYTAEQ